MPIAVHGDRSVRQVGSLLGTAIEQQEIF